MSVLAVIATLSALVALVALETDNVPGSTHDGATAFALVLSKYPAVLPLFSVEVVEFPVCNTSSFVVFAPRFKLLAVVAFPLYAPLNVVAVSVPVLGLNFNSFPLALPIFTSSSPDVALPKWTQ